MRRWNTGGVVMGALIMLLAYFGHGEATAEVTYVTPAQTEGPYYPVAKPADRDNDLAVVQGANGLPAGQVVELVGTLFDAGGTPVAGAFIEIWQTDNNGIYAHPNDRRTSQRDANFQFYGEALTAGDGAYRFRTILPGYYASRPRHIHAKIKLDGHTLLTTQFYFAHDPRKDSDSIFTRLADSAALIVDLDERVGTDGTPVLHGTRDIVLPP